MTTAAVPMISEWFVQQGFSKPGIVVVPDGDPVGRALRIAVSDGVDVVITSGGTGISPTDETPAQTRPLLDFELPGLAEAIRRSGLPEGADGHPVARGVRCFRARR